MYFDEMVDPIAVEVPGCPTITIERTLRTVVRTHYRVNRLWVADLESISYDTETGVLALTAPAGAEIVGIVSIQDDDGNPHRAAAVNNTYVLRTAPSSATLSVRVQLTVNNTTEELPDAVADRDQELIQSLVLSRLMAMPKREWTDLGMVAHHLDRAAALTLAARRVIDGWADPGVRVMSYGGI